MLAITQRVLSRMYAYISGRGLYRNVQTYEYIGAGRFKGSPSPLSLGAYVSITGPTGNRVKVG